MGKGGTITKNYTWDACCEGQKGKKQWEENGDTRNCRRTWKVRNCRLEVTSQTGGGESVYRTRHLYVATSKKQRGRKKKW